VNESSFRNDCLTNELVDDSNRNESVNYVSIFYNSGRTDERPLPPTVDVLVCFIRCHGNILTEPLSDNGLFRVYSLLCKRVLIPRKPIRYVRYVPSEPFVSEPLLSNGRLFLLDYFGFRPSCHNILFLHNVHNNYLFIIYLLMLSAYLFLHVIDLMTFSVIQNI
jgi:hypothetical protein